MTTGQLVQILGYVGLGGVLVAIITGLFSRRKLSAEATKIITDAASGVVEIQKAELARVVASNTVLTGQVAGQQIQLEDLQRIVRAVTESQAIHSFWDSQVADIAREHGIELPPPPPLTIGS